MFSHLVTAAKGFLTRQDAGGASPNSATDNDSKMVTTTRRGNVAGEPMTANAINGTPVANGKGKSGPARTGKKAGQNNKRRRSSVQDSEDENAQDESPNGTTESKQSPGKGGHIRFGSEEPALQHEVETENVSEPGSQNQDEDEDEESSDDEAPETIDNSAQLSKIKLEAQKREQTRQREENLKKEKRKQLDEQRKLQAQLTSKKKDAASADDLVSESTETLQGSITQEARRPGLPALLPDEILNAAPSTRPPSPPMDGVSPVHKKPNKLKFLDKVEKRPKDIKMDDMTIRVLDEGPSRKKAKTTLPPRSSKTGRNMKENWLKNARNTGQVNGLRRTTGGTSSFVRR